MSQCHENVHTTKKLQEEILIPFCGSTYHKRTVLGRILITPVIRNHVSFIIMKNHRPSTKVSVNIITFVLPNIGWKKRKPVLRNGPLRPLLASQGLSWPPPPPPPPLQAKSRPNRKNDWLIAIRLKTWFQWLITIIIIITIIIENRTDKKMKTYSLKRIFYILKDDRFCFTVGGCTGILGDKVGERTILTTNSNKHPK